MSLLYLSLLDLGFIAWVSYGWSIGNWALILSNTASFTIMTITILVALRFRRQHEPAAAPVAVASAAGSAAEPEADGVAGHGTTTDR